MLVDLDDLVSQCPDPRSRKYIRESVQCYKAGAYRASVVACWIAVAFDLVDKIREIAAGGDAGAQQVIARFDRARSSGDIREALTFEKELPTLARDNFEFISPIEHTDIERLVEDRNRCAHPSLVSDTEVFEVTPELSRLHIVNAIRYILSQPPAQGKAALDRLLSDLDSKFFPSKRADIEVFLRSGPLGRPRLSLLRNYCAVLLKIWMKEGDPGYEKLQRARHALFALRAIHPTMWEATIAETMAPIVRSVTSDRELLRTVRFLGAGDGVALWPYVCEADRLRLSAYTENWPGDEIGLLSQLFASSDLPLYKPAVARIRKTTAKEIFDDIWFDMPDLVIDQLIKLYGYQRSFAEANNFAKEMRSGLLDSSTPERHLAALIAVAAKNDQISGSNQFPHLLRDFVQNKKLQRMAVEHQLSEAGLPGYEW